MSYARAFNRLSDNDRHFGPLTISDRSTFYRVFGIDVRSGNDEYPGTSVNIKFAGWWLRIAIPAIVKPRREFHPVKGDAYWDAHGGGYYETFPREYGFTLDKTALHLRYGAQTHSSVTTKSRCFFLPWRQLRQVRFSLYGLDGAHFWSQRERQDIRGLDAFAAQREAQEACPKAAFEIEDYDGERARATTHIEEREWHRGEGWFRWLRWFTTAQIDRSLSINFDKEVGSEKGSWKGGLVGTSIEMLPGELHEAAFRRFCEKPVRNKYGPSSIKFVGSAGS